MTNRNEDIWTAFAIFVFMGLFFLVVGMMSGCMVSVPSKVDTSGHQSVTMDVTLHVDQLQLECVTYCGANKSCIQECLQSLITELKHELKSYE